MTPEHEISRLTAKINNKERDIIRLEKKLKETEDKHRRLIACHDSYSRDRWYIAYLQLEMMRLEKQYAERQETIDELLAMNRTLRNVTESFTVDNVK